MRWRKVNVVIFWNKLCLITSVHSKKERKKQKVFRVLTVDELVRPPSSSNNRAKGKSRNFSTFLQYPNAESEATMETQWNSAIQACCDNEILSSGANRRCCHRFTCLKGGWYTSLVLKVKVKPWKPASVQSLHHSQTVSFGSRSLGYSSERGPTLCSRLKIQHLEINCLAR